MEMPKRQKISKMPKKQEILEMFEEQEKLLKEALEKENIIYLTEEEFNETYPDAFASANETYPNLPMKGFIIKYVGKNGCSYGAIDNTTGDAWVEDFYMLEQAYLWIKGDGAAPKYKTAIIPSPQKMGRRWKR